MPSSIPYDPALTLWSVVDENTLRNVEAIAKIQSHVDAARDKLNSLNSSKKSLTTTKTELKNLGARTDGLDAELEKLNKSIAQAATDHEIAMTAAEPQIITLRKNISSAHKQFESPVDYLSSDVKMLPLAADSMDTDVQYFAFDANSQNSAAYSAQIGSYVSQAASSVFGASQSMKLGTAASNQVSRHLSSHNVQGTLVLSMSCKHKNASVVAPFVLHVDKAIKVWNQLFPGKELDATSSSSMMKCAKDESRQDGQKFSIVSGTTFGSSFVGMVHVQNSTDTSVSESLEGACLSLQRAMEGGSWFARAEGKVGLDRKFASDVKNLLSQHNIQSRVAVLTMGMDPSKAADEVSIAAEKFANFDLEANKKAAAAMQNATASGRQSMPEWSRTSDQASEMKGKAIEASLGVLSTVCDDKSNPLDVNSMMTALEDYLKKAAEGNSGVPVNYYLKDIDKRMLAELWIAKYHPGKFMSIKYDDSEDGLPDSEGEHWQAGPRPYYPKALRLG